MTVRPLLFALLPLLASCQYFSTQSAIQPLPRGERFQGELAQADGQWLFRPCSEQRQFLVTDSAASELLTEASALRDDGGATLFADLRGRLSASKEAGNDGQLEVSRVYRIQHEGHSCADANFKRLILRASGNEPGWSLSINNQGMLLEQPDRAPLALPYLEERLPEGRFNFSSDANQQHVELWVAPQRCIDSASGAVSHLSAELRLDNRTLRGCAYYGGARED